MRNACLSNDSMKWMICFDEWRKTNCSLVKPNVCFARIEYLSKREILVNLQLDCDIKWPYKRTQYHFDQSNVYYF